MAITGSGDIGGILEASRAIVALAPSISSTFATTATIPPDDLILPAAMQHIALDELERATVLLGAGQQRIDFQFALDVLVERTTDIEVDQATAMPLVEEVLQVFRENFTLGCPAIVNHCWPVNFRFVTISYGGSTFFGIRFVMACSTTSTVTLRA